MGWFNWHGHGTLHQTPPSHQIDAALERIVDSNPRLKLSPRYQTRLAPAVGRSLEFAHSVASALPAPRDASPSAWSQDPVIRAFFVSPDELCHAFSRSHELRDYFARNPGMDEAHALLGMAVMERKTLGAVQQGDTVRRDVPVTTISFDDHHARVCASDEPSLRDEITQRIIDELALRALELIAADQQRRDMLEHDRALLKTRLSLLARRGSGIRPAWPGHQGADPAALAKLRAELDDNKQQLAALGGHADALRRDLERMHDVLSEPSQHLLITERRLRLNAMNVLQADDSCQAGVDLTLKMAHFTTAPPQTRAFALVRFPRSGLRSASDMLDEAARLLV